MAVNDILNQLQLLIKGAAPQFIELNEQPTEVVPFIPGERYTAKVQAEISNGRFVVLIQDQKLDMNLPRSTQPGQNIALRFVSNDPRLTFVLADADATAQAAPPVKLSDSGRYLNSLLDRVKELAQQINNTPARASAVQGLEKPLLAGAPTSVSEFAAALKQAVAQSGLFYEAHQAQWVAGERPLAELLREPQGQLAEPRAAALAQNATAATSAASPATLPTKTEAMLLNSLPLAGTGADTKEAVHPQTTPIVQQQIELLDTRQMLWQGAIWPGQDMRWQIAERAPRGEEADSAREWQTRLDLRLPVLGELNAVLSISPQGAISIHVRAHTEATAQALNHAAPLLNQAMERAGLHLTNMDISQDG